MNRHKLLYTLANINIKEVNFRRNFNEQALAKSSSKILAVVVEDRGFHFCFADQLYSMVTATNLSDFVEKLNGIDDRAILFHYPRGDFQAWIREVLGDNELADRICFIAPNLPGEKLRKELQRIVQNRIKELTAIPL